MRTKAAAAIKHAVHGLVQNVLGGMHSGIILFLHLQHLS
jgi:hypothetical protein